jgi:Glyoxalase/Bleomycin resistance protein/Dioxygenase superfamily
MRAIRSSASDSRFPRIHRPRTRVRFFQYRRRRIDPQSGMKITAVLLVEEIEKSLPFWAERMGFEKTVEVPEGDRLGFVILAREGAELMLQTMESVRKDAPQFVPKAGTSVATFFIEVDDFADAVRRLEATRLRCSNARRLWHARDRHSRAGLALP